MRGGGEMARALGRGDGFAEERSVGGGGSGSGSGGDGWRCGDVEVCIHVVEARITQTMAHGFPL